MTASESKKHGPAMMTVSDAVSQICERMTPEQWAVLSMRTGPDPLHIPAVYLPRMQYQTEDIEPRRRPQYSREVVHVDQPDDIAAAAKRLREQWAERGVIVASAELTPTTPVFKDAAEVEGLVRDVLADMAGDEVGS
jgi:hypothetical protein